MFILTDEHIDFILKDIKNNGLENEDLILNLLDHICCIIEENLEECVVHIHQIFLIYLEIDCNLIIFL